jgi:nicotinate-nucleotide pyrophosphorylase (carboxylating)
MSIIEPQLPPEAIDRVIDAAIAEDLVSGDLTSAVCIEAEARASGVAQARHDMVVCGGAVFARVFQRIDAGVCVETIVCDGETAAAGSALWKVHGRARSILAAERIALNLVQRMSGVASMAQRYVAALPAGTHTRIADTRKTTPGLRALERFAVRTGGAHNHRDNLGSAVMIKDNHIVASGGLREAITRAQRHAPHTSRIEVEVTCLAEFDLALDAGADIVMLDNMSTADMAEAVTRRGAIAGRQPLLEASGGITLERIAEIARVGVDVISVGALTHSAPAADIGLDFSLALD